jgi:RNA polymerase sigma-70 factor (ECF subfamily)
MNARAATASVSPDETMLAAEARGGDRAAFAELVRRHQARVRVLISAYLRRPDQVDDLAQDVFLIAFRRLPTYRGEVPPRQWLLGIARKRLLEHLRAEARRDARHRRSLEGVLGARRVLRLEDDEELLRAERALTALETCLDALPPEGAGMLRAFYFEASTSGEIARRTGRGESGVRMALLRLRQGLRACLERRLSAEGPPWR